MKTVIVDGVTIIRRSQTMLYAAPMEDEEDRLCPFCGERAPKSPCPHCGRPSKVIYVKPPKPLFDQGPSYVYAPYVPSDEGGENGNC